MISATCCAAPATSPVWPPICARASEQSPSTAAAATTIAAKHLETPKPPSAGSKASGSTIRKAGRKAVPWLAAAAPAPSPRAGGSSTSGARQAQREIAPAAVIARSAPSGVAAERGQRAGAQAKAQNQRHRAEGADPAVLHDLQLALARKTAAEAVGDVGKAVLMQGPGDGRAKGQREQRRRGGGQTQAQGRHENQSARKAQQRAGERGQPQAALEIIRFRAGDRQAREEAQGAREIAPSIDGRPQRCSLFAASSSR